MGARIPRSLRRLAGTIAFATALAACGGGGEAAQSPDPTNVTGSETTSAPPASPTPAVEVGGGEPVELSIVARLGFTKRRLEVPPGAEVSLTMDNQDNIPHNVSVYVDDQMDEVIFIGDEVTSAEITYEFGAPVEPGTYFFVCDFHPTGMFGDFVVA